MLPILVPLVNPDGYEFSRNEDRQWRKNRRKNPGSSCRGVDLNRNFEKKFGTASSKNPCKEDFRGPEAFSEPETFTLASYIEDLQSTGTK